MMSSLHDNENWEGWKASVRERNPEQSMSLPQPRPRRALSRFTIASRPPPPQSLETLIPAYRTCAKESLPRVIVGQEDQKKMNIPPCPSPEPGGSRASSSKKEHSLQRKSFHKSLEDIRETQNQCDYEARPSSPRNNLPADGDQRKLGNETNSSVQSQTGRCQSNNGLRAPTDNNTITTIPPIQPGGGGDAGNLHNTLSDNGDSDYYDKTAEALTDDNELLKRQHSEARRKNILYRVINAFAFEALRRHSQRLVHLEMTLERRREECAARIVLHHLLLNSWRMTKGQVNAIMLENTHMHRTIDNQSLQLNIVRKMQSMEKDKSAVVTREYESLKKCYSGLLKENAGLKAEYAKVLEEKSSIEKHLRSLTDENSKMNIDLRIRLEKKEMQLRSMELDRQQAEKFSRENRNLTKEIESANAQIKELTTQQSQYQEKALSYESKCFQLQLEIENRDKKYQNIVKDREDMSKENIKLTQMKLELEKAVSETGTKLVKSVAEKKELEKSCTGLREEIDLLEERIGYLEGTLRQYKKENDNIRQKLYDCTLRNVQKRRVWGAALYFLVSPIEAFKRFYYGTPTRDPSPLRRARSPVPRRPRRVLDADITRNP